MGFTSKLFNRNKSSDTNLSRPDFEHAGVVDIHLGPVFLRIKDPQQTANIPLTSPVKNLNLNNTESFSRNSVGNFTKLLYKRGWNFSGDKGNPRGGVVVSLVAMYAPEDYKTEANFFNIDELKRIALEHCHILWGRQNAAKSVGDIGTGDIQYPTKIEQVEIKEINNINYAVIKKTSSNFAPVICYFSALSKRHTANISFTIDTYEGKDFYPVDFDSPETNLKEVAYWTIDQFMSRLELQRQT